MWGGRVEHFPGPSHFRAILDGWSYDHLFVHGCLIPVKFSGTHLLPENLGVTDVSEGRFVKYYNLARMFGNGLVSSFKHCKNHPTRRTAICFFGAEDYWVARCPPHAACCFSDGDRGGGDGLRAEGWKHVGTPRSRTAVTFKRGLPAWFNRDFLQ